MERNTKIDVTLRVSVTYDTDKITPEDAQALVVRRALDLNAHTVEQSVRICDVHACNVVVDRVLCGDKVVYDDERKLVFVNGERFEFVSNPTPYSVCVNCAFDRRECYNIDCVNIADKWGFINAYLVRTDCKE